MASFGEPVSSAQLSPVSIWYHVIQVPWFQILYHNYHY